MIRAAPVKSGAQAALPLADFARARGLSLRQVRYAISTRGAPVIGGRPWRIDPIAWDQWAGVSKLETARIRRDVCLEAIELVKACIDRMQCNQELVREVDSSLKPWIAERLLGYVHGSLAAALATLAGKDGLPLAPKRRKLHVARLQKM